MVKGFRNMDEAVRLALSLSRENPVQAVRVAIRLDGDHNTDSILVIDDDEDALRVLSAGPFLWACYVNAKEVADPRFNLAYLEALA